MIDKFNSGLSCRLSCVAGDAVKGLDSRRRGFAAHHDKGLDVAEAFQVCSAARLTTAVGKGHQANILLRICMTYKSGALF